MFSIGLGYCGPTDACLCLINNREIKEYAIETTAWQLLSLFWDILNQKTCDNFPQVLVEWIWNNCDPDIFIECRQLSNFKVGDVVYKKCNPDVIPRGYTKLIIKTDLSYNDKYTYGTLTAVCQDTGLKYNVNMWHESFLTEEPKC